MTHWHPFPAELYALVEHSPGSVLLESSRPDSVRSTSRLFLSPLRILEAHQPCDIAEILAQIEAAVTVGHYAAGYFTYECGAAFEPAIPARTLPGNEPLAWFGIYERCYPFDHATGKFVDGNPPGIPDTPSPPPPINEPSAGPLLAPILDEEHFTQSIDTIHELIRAGDVYQLNFTFPLRGHFAGSPASLFAQLRKRQPVDYGALLHPRAGQHILSLSPELFFRIDETGSTRRITTRPMKGTARRGRTTEEDRRIAEHLHNDPKNRAENVMIVDLLRNDLGRICAFGSVQVQHLFAVERYPTLWQMTSTVTGSLRPNVNYADLLRAIFPSGSITGAPKVRAMQLLAALEPQPRGIYTGAIGFFSRETAVFNVAIRTLQLNESRATIGVGSGIVIDSVASQEYRECLLKAEFLTRSTEPFSLIETMLWQNEFPLLDLHLDRLQDSSDYFGFPFHRDNARNALFAAASRFTEPHRVRLLLDADGATHIETAPLTTGTSGPARICIATQRTCSGDRFLFHKTTHRPLYTRAFTAATAAGFADVLFLNERDEVTEGAISNVFVEKGGRWLTPPIECGVLPGIYRRHLLATRSAIEERLLTLDDLKSADTVYIANALRGLRPVTIDWAFQLP